jgi:hypothetical protein
VRTEGPATEATSCGRPTQERASVLTTLALFGPLGVSNKPVLPTATNDFDEHSPGPLRRQTGQPLDIGAAGSELRRAKPGPRSSGNEQ